MFCIHSDFQLTVSFKEMFRHVLITRTVLYFGGDFLNLCQKNFYVYFVQHQTAALVENLVGDQIFWCNQNLQETLFFVKLNLSACGFENGGNFRSCDDCHEIFFGSESNHDWQCDFQVILQSYDNIAIGMFISYKQQTVFRWPH